MTAIIGSLTATGAGSALRLASPNFNLEIRGTFTATVRLERSLDEGANWTPLTEKGTSIMSFTAPAAEKLYDYEPGAQYRVYCSAFTSGTIYYRLSQ